MSNNHRAVWCWRACWAGVLSVSWADDVVWTCSRAESEQPVFKAVKAYRIDNLSIKDDNGIAITLSDLYGAYAGEPIQMGQHVLKVCSLPAVDPLQKKALDVLGYRPEDLRKALQSPRSGLVSIPSIHEMLKCIAENHPAIGFFPDVVENESMTPCF
jgi:hypothetical protein